MKSEVPLTPEQRVFAAEHHDLVFNFLRENGLAEDEYYDIVIFGYLKAVSRYFSQPALRRYTFGTVAWKAMQGALSNHQRTAGRKRRWLEVVSVHLDLPQDDQYLTGESRDYSELMLQLEADLILHDLARHVSQRQMDAIRMRSDGYGIRDIAHRQNATVKEVNTLLDKAHVILRELCYE